MIDSPQMVDSIRRFKAVAGGAEMLEQRYPPLQPEFFRPCPIDSEAQWLTQRVATTHDIHHVVAGFGTMPAGESGVLAITAAQIGFLAYVLLTTAGPRHGDRPSGPMPSGGTMGGLLGAPHQRSG